MATLQHFRLNGFEHGWAALSLKLGITGASADTIALLEACVQGIDYSDGYEIGKAYALGAKAQGHTVGNHDVSGTITLNKSGELILKDIGAPFGGIEFMPAFDMIVEFSHPARLGRPLTAGEVPGLPTTESLNVKPTRLHFRGVRFGARQASMKQGDGQFSVSIPFSCAADMDHQRTADGTMTFEFDE